MSVISVGISSIVITTVMHHSLKQLAQQVRDIISYLAEFLYASGVGAVGVSVTLPRGGYSGVHKASLCTPLQLTSQSETSSVQEHLPLHC